VVVVEEWLRAFVESWEAAAAVVAVGEEDAVEYEMLE
jgi:hypothetical protein